MKLTVFILLVVIVSLVSAAPNGRRRSSRITTESLIEKHGYPFEEHTVQTSDGYVLTMHRIPYSSQVESSEDGPRPVAFLMHGILCSSSDWVILGPGNGLAYLLSDAGYDVWLGNARGNTYSREHVSLNPFFKSFWNFDWHEIGLYDLPAMIDYIRYYTDEDQVTYFGHSQGTTTFLLLNSLNERFSSRIRSAHLLAPVAFMENMESPMMGLTSLMLGGVSKIPELFGNLEFLPSNEVMSILGQKSCSDSSPIQGICTNVLFLIAGHDSENLNTTMLPEILATTPAGCSINQGFHYLQEFSSGEFRQFDYGMVRNKLTYGKKSPPNYPLEKINVPIYLYYSDNDYMASVVDVHRLIRALPDSTVKRAYRVPHDKWNHLDFLWGLNIREQVYDAVMEDVEIARQESMWAK
ncbi:lipase 3-like [Episyrphus balteatus]|uniref:lipase 3-like n=1 Tax=Episyrphus balteatus TaxID=286459 RepID=UPI002485C036|nr:lipase 3-like [Episyrphus balteatus]